MELRETGMEVTGIDSEFGISSVEPFGSAINVS